jgi:hypothetical protein
MGARVYALVILALVSAVFLTLTLTSGATFTAPTANPSNQLATATLAAPTGVSAIVQSNGGTVRVAWTATSSTWASGHRVFRATNAGGPYSQIQQIAGRATVIYDDVPGVGTFFYVVRGYYNANGANWESVNSAQASAKPLDHFAFNAIAAQHSGVAFNVTITAQAQDNSTVTGFTGTVTLATNSGTIVPTTSGAFVAGVRTESITITGPYKSNQTISVTGGSPSRTGTSAVFVLDHFRATAIAINNKAGGVAGKPENGDSIVLTFSEAANTASMGTCNGATNSGTDLLTNDANPDTMTSNGTNLSFGTIALGNNGYFTANKNAKNSTCAWTVGNTVLTITLQGVSSVGTVAGAGTATYTPDFALTSAAGEAVDTAQTPSVTAVLF